MVLDQDTGEQVRLELEKLRRDLEQLVGRSGRRSSEPELDYHLARLTIALTAFNMAHHFRPGLYAHSERAELLG